MEDFKYTYVKHFPEVEVGALVENLSKFLPKKLARPYNYLFTSIRGEGYNIKHRAQYRMIVEESTRPVIEKFETEIGFIIGTIPESKVEAHFGFVGMDKELDCERDELDSSLRFN